MVCGYDCKYLLCASPIYSLLLSAKQMALTYVVFVGLFNML